MSVTDTSEKGLETLIMLHMTGADGLTTMPDWGELSDADRAENEFSLLHGFRLLSVYDEMESEVRFWVLTEADRTVTNVKLHISNVMLSLQKC